MPWHPQALEQWLLQPFKVSVFSKEIRFSPTDKDLKAANPNKYKKLNITRYDQKDNAENKIYNNKSLIQY